MPNYNLYVGRSRYYDPTEFQTLREDLKNMTDQYNTTMAAYGEMSSKADLFEKLANDVKGKDSVAYQNYMNYANAIRQHTDLLATQGLTPSTMRNLVQAKNDYNRIIAPIEEAYNAREAEAKRQAEYMAKYPGAIFERDANKMGIDQWMKNPSYRAKSLDREAIANRAKERFAALQKKIQEFVSEHGHVDPSTMDANQLKQWVKTNIPYEYQALEKYGVSPDDVKALMLGDPKMQSSILQAIVNDTMGMYGVDTWNTDYDHYTDAQNQQNRFNIYNQVYNSIRGEAPNSIGEDKYDNKTDNITWQERLRWAELAEEKRQFDEKMAAAKAATEDPESINVDDAAASNPTLIKGDLDQEKLLDIAEQLRVIEVGGENAFKDVTSSQLADAIEEVKEKHNGVLSLQDPNTIKELQEAAKRKHKEETYWLSGLWEAAKGGGKVLANLLLKTTNPIGMATQVYGAKDKGFGYFAKSLIGASGDDMIDVTKNAEMASDYFALSTAKNALKDYGDKPLSENEFKEKWKRDVRANPYVKPGDDSPEKADEAYRHYIYKWENDKPRTELFVKELEEKIGKNDESFKNAYDENMKELKKYGYTEDLLKMGISPEFYSCALVNSNLINWNSFDSSVLNETSRKDLAQGFNEMITDKNNPDKVRLYEIGEKDLTDRVSVSDWKALSGANPQENNSGQLPVFSTNAKLGVLTVTYKDADGKPVTYAVKPDDIHRHPGFSEKFVNGLKEEHRIYELMSDPKKFYSMTNAEKDKYTKGLFKGISNEEQQKAAYDACAAWFAAADPNITTVSQLDARVKSMSPAEMNTIITRLGMMAYLEGHNHDNINVIVKNTLWGKSHSDATPARKQLFESWKLNN